MKLIGNFKACFLRGYANLPSETRREKILYLFEGGLRGDCRADGLLCASSVGWSYLQVKTPLKCGSVFCLATICFLFSQSRRRQVRKKQRAQKVQLLFNGVDNVSHGDTKRAPH